MAFVPRLDAPQAMSPYWRTIGSGGYNRCIHISSGSVLPNCVGYAYGRFMEIMQTTSCNLSTRNAGLWYGHTSDGYQRGAVPRLGAVICWERPGQAGHVAIVEQINSDGSIVTSNSAYGGTRFYTQTLQPPKYTWSSKYILQGFIYNPAVASDSDVTVDNIVNIEDIYNQIDHTKLSPYVVTIDRNSPSVDYNLLRSKGIIGTMIECGGLYDLIHLEKSYYRNPQLDAQINDALDAGMPYGLYADVRSRSVAEALRELNHLTLCIQKYSPPLGVWLQLNFNNGKSINNAILNIYKETLEQVGLKGKIGLYVSDTQLSKVDWESMSSDWMLWLIDHVDNISELDTLLTPEFFDNNPDIRNAKNNNTNDVVTEQVTKLSTFVTMAKSCIGVSATDISNIVGNTNRSWSAAFVVACAKLSTILNKVIPDAVSPGELFKLGVEQNMGTWCIGPYFGMNPQPQVGDLVSFRYYPVDKYKDQYMSDHIGIVSEIRDKVLCVVAGDAHGVVTLKQYDSDDITITGFFKPDWTKLNSMSELVGGYIYGTSLYSTRSDNTDATIREVSYVYPDGNPTTHISEIRYSVVNYTTLLSAFFGLVPIPTSVNQLSSIITDGLTGAPRAVVQTLMGFGLSAAASIGIVGNIKHESNFNTGAVGDNGTSFGICQWHYGRGKNMKTFVGADWAVNLSGQVEFLWHELNQSYRHSVLIPLQSVPNTEAGARTAADIFVRKFEIPANVDSESIKRQASAAEYWKQIIIQQNISDDLLRII